jgi:hypothetical protein
MRDRDRDAFPRNEDEYPPRRHSGQSKETGCHGIQPVKVEDEPAVEVRFDERFLHRGNRIWCEHVRWFRTSGCAIPRAIRTADRLAEGIGRDPLNRLRESEA